MNRLILAPIALAAAIFAAPSFADDITPEPATIASTTTRAQVQAELLQFRGSVSPWSQTYNPLNAFRGERTRAEVAADFQRSRVEAAALSGEDSGSAYLATRSPDATRVLAGQPVEAQ